MSSQFASISAWKAVFDWPSMVAAAIVGRHVVARSSAAFSRIAARSSQRQVDQSRCASPAALMAACTSCVRALCHVAVMCPCLCGDVAFAMSPVRISFPPMTSGISGHSFSIAARRVLSAARSGEPGAYERMGSFVIAAGRRLPSNGALDMVGFWTWVSRP